MRICSVVADSRYAGNGKKDRSEKLLLLPAQGDAAAILVLLPFPPEARMP